jgi:LmbE family N-acetylglucosaminyl deacetylase
MTRLSLMAVFAHPDDESLAIGGAVARYASEGVEVNLVTATRGEKGRFFDNSARPPQEEIGVVRERELRAAAARLGIGNVTVLGYVDGELCSADPIAISRKIAAEIRRRRPHVVVTFDPWGAYGHPDHVAICQFATAAVPAAADPDFEVGEDLAAHRVSKLYYVAMDARAWDIYQRTFKTLVSRVDGVERHVIPWPDWSLTTHVDARAHWETVWGAIREHRTQMAAYGPLESLSAADHQVLWGQPTFYRVFSLVNGGRAIETDMFAGLR